MRTYECECGYTSDETTSHKCTPEILIKRAEQAEAALRLAEARIRLLTSNSIARRTVHTAGAENEH